MAIVFRTAGYTYLTYRILFISWPDLASHRPHAACALPLPPQSVTSAYIGGIASTGKLVSPIILKTLYWLLPSTPPDGNFDLGVE